MGTRPPHGGRRTEGNEERDEHVIDRIAGKYNLSPCALPGPHHNADVAWIKTDDWPEEALAELAHVVAKQFSPEGYCYVACESINPLCVPCATSP